MTFTITVSVHVLCSICSSQVLFHSWFQRFPRQTGSIQLSIPYLFRIIKSFKFSAVDAIGRARAFHFNHMKKPFFSSLTVVFNSTCTSSILVFIGCVVTTFLIETEIQVETLVGSVFKKMARNLQSFPKSKLPIQSNHFTTTIKLDLHLGCF